MNRRGSMLVGALFMVAFLALVSVPVTQRVVSEYKSTINGQLAVKAHYAAEAGLAYGQALTLSGEPFPVGPVSLDGGVSFFRLKQEVRTAANSNVHLPYLVSEGMVGSASSAVSKCLGKVIIKAHFLTGALTLTSPSEPFNVLDKAVVTVQGDMVANADVEAASNNQNKMPTLDVNGSVMVAGSFDDTWLQFTDNVPDRDNMLIGLGTFEMQPIHDFMADFYLDNPPPGTTIRNFQNDADLSSLLTNNTYTLAGQTEYWYTGNLKNAMNNLIIDGTGTLIVEGDLTFKKISGSINLIVRGNITELTGSGTNHAMPDLYGLVYCTGTLTTKSLWVEGSVIAGNLSLGSAGDTATVTYNRDAVPITDEEARPYTTFGQYIETTWGP